MSTYKKNYLLFIKGPDRIETFHINADEISVEADGWYFIGRGTKIARFNPHHVIGYSDVPVFENNPYIDKFKIRD